MSAAKAETASGSAAESRASFFRQSGWLIIATFFSGALMWGVHFFAKVIPEDQYSIYGALLALTMCVPIMPLQMVMAQQSASALATGRGRQLTRMFRHTWLAITLFWVLAAAVILYFQTDLVARFQLASPHALWVTLVVILTSAWLPLLLGLLQGMQDFMTFGWAMIINAVGRLGGGAVIVLALGGKHATGIMIGALAGLLAGVALCVWRSRKVWSAPSEPYEVGSFLSQVVPLLAGFGACQILMAADTLVVRAYLSENSQCYVTAGTLSRALVWAVGPLTSVMFPRIVASAARAQKSNLFGLTLACTAAMATIGVLGLWLLGPWVVRFIAKPSYVEITTQILPWYAAAMVPLCVANVLASNLLGNGQFRVVIPMVLLAVGYVVTLQFVHGSFIQVLQMLGLFNLGLLLICAAFTFLKPKARETV